MNFPGSLVTEPVASPALGATTAAPGLCDPVQGLFITQYTFFVYLYHGVKDWLIFPVNCLCAGGGTARQVIAGVVTALSHDLSHSLLGQGK